MGLEEESEKSLDSDMEKEIDNSGKKKTRRENTKSERFLSCNEHSPNLQKRA